MMDYQYRRKAYEILSEQKEEVIEECKQTYTTNKYNHVLKSMTLSISAFFAWINDTF
ncbi:hypothetical protein [Metabacillus iocasae]|uniref:CHASE3 domain sensor protein n=1 Tax=Priestia iocasae TaxID=2291674 RepID=A0ABS2QUJ3_9BACI|nr:hypothetical protein [Metabacillus iocasae]MBM7703155.1 CHASE3 domain sensor protein [Metabacillus iocasae]